jgi:hypothetical protein
MGHRLLVVMLGMAVALGIPLFSVGQAPSGTKTFDETAVNTNAAIKALGNQKLRNADELDPASYSLG